MVGGETQFGCFPTLINKILSDGGLAAGYSATSPVSFTGEHYGAGKMTVPLWNELLANSGKDRTLNYQDNKKLIKCTETGCGKPDCDWCNFVKSNHLAVELHPPEEEEAEL